MRQPPGWIQSGRKCHTGRESQHVGGSELYIYPKFGSGRLTTCIKVFDKYLNGTSGEVTIKSGGVNNNNVNIIIRGIEGLGMYYNIETYGR